MQAQNSRIVYLIHFDQVYKRVRHYIGSADDLDARLAQHRAGNGARLMEVITDAGIAWRVARTWNGDRKFERQLKRLKVTRERDYEHFKNFIFETWKAEAIRTNFAGARFAARDS
jgi:predicted GIY-YIG superfamily endonuclease